jgi:sensor histidine kinase YesM
MILITFLENAFKYSSLSEKEKSKININLSLQHQSLTFEIDNSFDDTIQNISDIPNESRGFGIQNAKTLLQMSYPNKHSLSIDKKEQRFYVQLKMDLS